MGLERAASCNSAKKKTKKPRSYFWIKDGKKAVHVDLFTDELGLEETEKKHVRMWFDCITADKSLHTRLTLAIWTTLGNSVRQEMGITSWWVFSLFLVRSQNNQWGFKAIQRDATFQMGKR